MDDTHPYYLLLAVYYSNFILQHYVVYKSTQIGLGQKNSWKIVNYFKFLVNFLVNYFWKLVAN